MLQFLSFYLNLYLKKRGELPESTKNQIIFLSIIYLI